ncbi:hypothetical protein JSE7799_01191 [Jannaschia seosinensis]|uniref:Uncharacterized protein n=1 Tax=Jannaschia seosinensis TaxID=313367 RepID=A0A0M7BB42_9RHOB|nr:hypothetical protein [Jannaschia seosinensis]CUH36244.1 hypothetical protein JSE7799_01191 [Jannaschia seosinensis]
MAGAFGSQGCGVNFAHAPAIVALFFRQSGRTGLDEIVEARVVLWKFWRALQANGMFRLKQARFKPAPLTEVQDTQTCTRCHL